MSGQSSLFTMLKETARPGHEAEFTDVELTALSGWFKQFRAIIRYLI